jgi:hypothetical protein
MKREDIKEYLDCNGFEALTSSDGTKYYNEEVVINIALEVVKNCYIPAVVGRSEQLCPDCGNTGRRLPQTLDSPDGLECECGSGA